MHDKPMSDNKVHFSSAQLKVDRASEHIADLNKMLSKKRPFSYVLETNLDTRQRMVRTEQDETIVKRASLVCGDALHNLRSALDQVYWQIVSPHVPCEKERSQIQFPFCKDADQLERKIKKRLADRVGIHLMSAIRELKPYMGSDGNHFLVLVHEVNIVDKHKFLPPTADYTQLSSERLRQEVSDFPDHMNNVFFSSNGLGDVCWKFEGVNTSRLGKRNVETGRYEQKLSVPVEILLKVPELNYSGPLIPTLYKMREATTNAIEVLNAAVSR